MANLSVEILNDAADALRILWGDMRRSSAEKACFSGNQSEVIELFYRALCAAASGSDLAAAELVNSANIYKSLYYTRNVSENQEAFVQALFGTETPMMPAAEQKETFQSILSETIAEDCNMNIVKAVHTEIAEMIEEHKNTKNQEPLTIKKENIKDVLTSCSVPEERIQSFEERFDEVFGEDTEISAVNLANKQLEVHTADVSIKVNGERGDLIRTKIIDGVKYILIRADDSVEVNGVKISINK